ncbi:hypothetical protein [Novacetimonas hansenii]|uniref:Uncharacterized protein n=1 Tax=Novacetimonas hansenii TaxID=436 RepID=A0AAW5ERK2_NOVHA|nr:hypothetical protein [Novacetimonas hansenii]MCJ8352930.1 hypothetical protein [Novacetimonas hansenii]
MADMDVRGRLRECAIAMATEAAAGSVLRWLTEHHDAVVATRPRGGSWKPVIAIMREDGLNISADHSGLRKVRKLWVQVQATRKKHAGEQIAPGEADPPVHNTHPSRLPQDWKPDLIDDGQKNLPHLPDASTVPAPIVSAEKSAQVASLPTTVTGCSGSETTGEKSFPIGRARAEAIKRDLLARLKRKEPGFHRE